MDSVLLTMCNKKNFPSYEDKTMNLNNEELEEYSEIFQDILALRGDFRLF